MPRGRISGGVAAHGRTSLAAWPSRRSVSASIICSMPATRRLEPRQAIAADPPVARYRVGCFILDVAEPGRVPGTGPQRTYIEGRRLGGARDQRRRSPAQILRRARSPAFAGSATFTVAIRKSTGSDCSPRSELAAQLRDIGFRVRFSAATARCGSGRGTSGLLRGSRKTSPNVADRARGDVRRCELLQERVGFRACEIG